MNSQILIVDHPQPSLLEVGADFISKESFTQRVQQGCSVLVAPVRALKRGEIACPEHALLVLVIEEETPEELFSILGETQIYRLSEGWLDPALEMHILAALAEMGQAQQQKRLLQTLREQNEHLTKLSADIERQVEFRLNELESQKRDLLRTQDRLEVIHQALISAFRADSIPELELKMTESLTPEFGVDWTRIRYTSQTGSDPVRLTGPYLQLPLMRDDRTTGTVTFGRTLKNFDREERRLLDQVAQTLNLILRRIERWMELERSRIGWEATFDAIREPLSIIDQDRNIIRVNQEFAASASMAIDQISGRKCYEVLFQRTQKCEGCKLGSTFRLPGSFEVSSQNAGTSAPLLVGENERSMYLNLYRDLSARLKAEKRLIESAKLAELGTISSSIAHELNNPLGGMLAYLQLIAADLKNMGESVQGLKDDVAEMEQSVRRCSEIVKSLLIYIRKNPEYESEVSELREAVDQAVQIVSLQTRALGVHIGIQQSANESFKIGGHFNLVVQLFCLILQQSNSALQRRRATGGSSVLASTVTLGSSANSIHAEVEDTGLYETENSFDPGPVVRQLIDELDATLTVHTNSGSRKISLSFPRIQSEMDL